MKLFTRRKKNRYGRRYNFEPLKAKLWEWFEKGLEGIAILSLFILFFLIYVAFSG